MRATLSWYVGEDVQSNYKAGEKKDSYYFTTNCRILCSKKLSLSNIQSVKLSSYPKGRMSSVF